jgi:hypothetical protein
MMEPQDRKPCADWLREIADKIERGEVAEFFAAALSDEDKTDPSFCGVETQACGSNLGMAHAIIELAGRINCCTSGDCFSGSIKAAVIETAGTFVVQSAVRDKMN